MRALLALVLLLLLAAPAWAGPSEQGLRQVAFARSELADGEFEAALRSAESAIRLSPDLYEATLVKALAYEGLGDLELARSLLLGYLEEVPSVEQDPEAGEALTRIDGRLARGRARVPRPAPTRRQRAAEAPVDIEPYRQRITAALEQGRSQAAWSAAQEMARAAPESVESWELAGTAANSAGRKLDSLRAYRRYQALGGDDPRISQVADLLSAEFGTIEVNLMGRLAGFSPRVTLTVGGDEFRSPLDGPSHTFRDLPPGEPATLRVDGRGLMTASKTVDAPGPGASVLLDLPVDSIGFGTLVFSDWPGEELDVQVHNEGEWAPAAPASRQEVTAGTTTLRVTGLYGHVDADLGLFEGQDLAVDPRAYWPSLLTLSGLPAGSEVRIFIEGPNGLTLELLRAISRRNAQPDPATGIPVAPPQRFRSLPGGRVGVFITHPRWGEGALEIALMGGRAQAAVFEVATLPNQPEGRAELVAPVAPSAAEMASRRRADKAEKAATLAAGRTTTRATPRPPPTLIVSAGLGGVAVGGLVAMAAYRQEATARRDEAEQLVDADGFHDLTRLSDLRDSVEDARRKQHEAGVVAVLGGAAALLSAGIVLSVHFGGPQ